MATARTTSGPDVVSALASLTQRVADLETQRTSIISTAAAGATVGAHSITDTQVGVNALTGASLSLGLALQGSLATAYGFVNNSTGVFVTTPSQFSYASSFTDPDSGVNRDAKFGALGIAVKGGTKTDTLNVTGASTLNNVTMTSIASFTTSAITFSQPVTFPSSVSFVARSIPGTAVAFDSITGGAGAGVGNLAAGTVQGYNVLDASLPFTKLTGTAQTQITALTVQDTPFSFLRRVSSTGTAVDANNTPTDGLTINNGATRVADALAYTGTAINSAGATTPNGIVGGPAYTGLVPGQYQATVYLRAASGTTAGNIATAQMTGTSVTDNPATTITWASLSTAGYRGFVMPFTVTAAGGAVNLVLASTAAGGTAAFNFSHIRVEPSGGAITSNVVDSFLTTASITSAKINSLSADKIAAGTISSDNIFLGAGGHIYAGTAVTSPTGNTARIEMNAAGLYGYDGTQNTFALTNSGLTVTGTVNATAGTFSGTLNVTGTLTGGTISGSTITGATITGTTITGATISGTSTITGALIASAASATVTRSVLDAAYGFYLNLAASTNYVLNPGAEYYTYNSSTTYNIVNNWTTTAGVMPVVALTLDPNASITRTAMAPGRKYAFMGSSNLSNGNKLAIAVAAGDTTFQSNDQFGAGMYVSFENDVAQIVHASTTVVPQPVNIINPGFETGTLANWTTNWKTLGTGGTTSVVTTAPHSGTYCAALVTTASGNATAIATADAYPCQPGNIIYVAGWVKASAASAQGLYVQISFSTTNSWTFASGQLSESNIVANAALTTSWTQYTGNVTVPATAAYFKVELVHWANSPGTVWFDDLSVSQAAQYAYTLETPILQAHALNSTFLWADANVHALMANLAPSTTYVATFNIASGAGSPGGSAEALFFDANHCYILEAAGAQRKYPLTATHQIISISDNDWRTYSWQFTTPSDFAGPARMVISGVRSGTGALANVFYAGIDANTGFYYDNLQVEPGGVPTDYFDGDQGAGFAWLGAAGASASTRALQKQVDLPQYLGTSRIAGTLSLDSLYLPRANVTITPDQAISSTLPNVSSAGGIDINGRGVQTTMCFCVSGGGVTGTPPLSAGFVMASTNLSGISFVTPFKAGRLYRFTFNCSGVSCSVTGTYTIRIYLNYFNNNPAQILVPWFAHGSITGGQTGLQGSYVFYWRCTADLTGADVTVMILGGASTGTYSDFGGHQLEVSDMGIWPR